MFGYRRHLYILAGFELCELNVFFVFCFHHHLAQLPPLQPKWGVWQTFLAPTWTFLTLWHICPLLGVCWLFFESVTSGLPFFFSTLKSFPPWSCWVELPLLFQVTRCLPPQLLIISLKLLDLPKVLHYELPGIKLNNSVDISVQCSIDLINVFSGVLDLQPCKVHTPCDLKLKSVAEIPEPPRDSVQSSRFTSLSSHSPHSSTYLV